MARQVVCRRLLALILGAIVVVDVSCVLFEERPQQQDALLRKPTLSHRQLPMTHAIVRKTLTAKPNTSTITKGVRKPKIGESSVGVVLRDPKIPITLGDRKQQPNPSMQYEDIAVNDFMSAIGGCGLVVVERSKLEPVIRELNCDNLYKKECINRIGEVTAANYVLFFELPDVEMIKASFENSAGGGPVELEIPKVVMSMRLVDVETTKVICTSNIEVVATGLRSFKQIEFDPLSNSKFYYQQQLPTLLQTISEGVQLIMSDVCSQF